MRLSLPLLLLCVTSMLAACAETLPMSAQAPGPMFVATGVQTGGEHYAPHVLPTNSFAEAFIPRASREALAPPVAVGGSFVDHMYDHEPIGNPDGYGYRYRSVYRFGYTLP